MKEVDLSRGRSPNYSLTAKMDRSGAVLTFMPKVSGVQAQQVILTAEDIGQLIYAWRQVRKNKEEVGQ